MTTVYHNALALQNARGCRVGSPSNLQWFEHGEWVNGSQWTNGADAGDPTAIASSGPGHLYATSNLTNLRNRPALWSPADSATNVTQATRSIVWIANDYIDLFWPNGSPLTETVFETRD